MVTPRQISDPPDSGPPTWESDWAHSWAGGRWVHDPPAREDVGEALHVLQAIRILQRWVSARPLGADALYLTSTNLTLIDGEHVVATIPIPAA